MKKDYASEKRPFPEKGGTHVALPFGTREDGFEYPDPTPVEIPTRLKLPQRQVDRVREIVQREMSRAAEQEGYESFAEADDFDLPGEEPISPYEEVFEPVVESVAPQSAVQTEIKDGYGTEVGGRGKTGGRVGTRPGDKGAGKADGKAGESAGSGNGAGSSGEGDEGDKG